jgi:hypothetical protein
MMKLTVRQTKHSQNPKKHIQQKFQAKNPQDGGGSFIPCQQND